MLWILTFVLVLTVAVAATAALLGVRRAATFAILGAAGIVGLVAGIILAWRYVVVAVAIGGVSILALAVMYQKVPPVKAIVSALAAFVLFFVFSWLALQLAEPFLFHRESQLFELVERWQWHSPDWHAIFAKYDSLGIPAGLALLFSAAFIRGGWRTLAVFGGFLLLMLGFSSLTASNLQSLAVLLREEDPLKLVIVLGLGVLAVVSIVKILSQTNGCDKSEERKDR